MIDRIKEAFTIGDLTLEQGKELYQAYMQASNEEKENTIDLFGGMIIIFLSMFTKYANVIPQLWWILGLTYGLGNPYQLREKLKSRLEEDTGGYLWATLISILAQIFYIARMNNIPIDNILKENQICLQ